MLTQWHRARPAYKKLKNERLTGRRICKGCGLEKDFKFSHRVGMKSVFRDETGRLWQSRLCADCHYTTYIK